MKSEINLSVHLKESIHSESIQMMIFLVERHFFPWDCKSACESRWKQYRIVYLVASFDEHLAVLFIQDSF